MKLLIISDIHANWPALRAVLEAESDADEILCLGDLVDYGPEPLRCVEWTFEHVSPTRLVQGNHDWAVGCNQRPHCSAAYRHLADVTRRHAVSVLGKRWRDFLRELSSQRFFSIDGAKCAACHALPSDPLHSYLLLSENFDEWRQEVDREGRPDFLFVGHTHIGGELRVGHTCVVNPGSVGQPKDGDPRAAYAVWQDGTVTLRRAAYDVEETVRAYEQTSLSPADIACARECFAHRRHIARISASYFHMKNEPDTRGIIPATESAQRTDWGGNGLYDGRSTAAVAA